jgi:predicted dehydrogenase
MDRIRIGVIGGSRGLQLARACQDLAAIEVSIILDSNAETAQRAAKEVGASVAPSLPALLDADIDAVIVASPIPQHLDQVRATVDAGKHVLSEVTPCATLAEASELVAVVSDSGCLYMLAENYCYFSEVETVRRLHQAERFGEVYYAECDHLIDIRQLWRTDSGELTWRGRGEVGIYCTHGLGSLLTILDDRIATVSAVTVDGGKFDPAVTQPTMYLLQMTTDKGVRVRLRIDLTSPRPPLGAYYALQGTRGCYESWRGLGDQSKVWLEDEHGSSSLSAWAQWHPLDDVEVHDADEITS